MNSSARRLRPLTALSAVLLVCILGACGSIPQPFRGSPTATTDNPLVDVPGAMGVAVVPPAGMPPEQASALADAVVHRLMAMEVPAQTVDSVGGLGFTLSGRAIADAPGTYMVLWTLRSRRGGERGAFSTAVRTPASDEIAGTIATQVATALGLVDVPDQSAAHRPPAKSLPSVSIKPVVNAPSDAGESLRLAVLQALADAGARRDDVNPDVTLEGHVEITQYDSASDRVTITWHAVTRDGRDLGTAKVENTIPDAVVQGPWGPTAFAVASALQRDLVRLISSAAP